MDKLIPSAFKAIGSVFAPGMLGVFSASIAVTLAALIGFVTIVTSLTVSLTASMPETEITQLLPWMSGLGASMVAYFLFPGIMPVIVNFFDAKIARIIEAKYYPEAQPINPPFWPEFWHDLRFTLKAIGLNILALPLYVIPLIGQLAFFALNGHLLGREFFIMAARRYMPLADAITLRKTHGRTIFIGGMMLTLFATVPFVNLFAPFWGIALMTHFYHTIKPRALIEVLPPTTA